MNDFLKRTLLESCQAKNIIKQEELQTLWSGYGTLSRITMDSGSVILKLITPPIHQSHPRNWATDFSHQRKLKSYQVEMLWYQKYNKLIDNAYFPKLITAGQFEDSQYLLLEDLCTKGFQTEASINENQVKLCLKWLAYFHASHLNVSTNDLWSIGTYWHLETRPDEFDALKDQELKSAAVEIDKRLNLAKYQTLVHGDAKLANFLFEGDESCAAVDFQYVGGGVGVKDIAYFLSSIYCEQQLMEKECWALDFYFSCLNRALEKNKVNIDFIELENQWRELYPFAWCDFMRFLKGWAPEHYKINNYTELMKKKVLACILN